MIILLSERVSSSNTAGKIHTLGNDFFWSHPRLSNFSLIGLYTAVRSELEPFLEANVLGLTVLREELSWRDFLLGVWPQLVALAINFECPVL